MAGHTRSNIPVAMELPCGLSDSMGTIRVIGGGKSFSTRGGNSLQPRRVRCSTTTEGGCMSTISLNALVLALGMSPAPRYSIEETATILGLNPKQVRTQIKKGHLAAIRGSRRRWSGVFHADLESYFASVNTKGGE